MLVDLQTHVARETIQFEVEKQLEEKIGINIKANENNTV